MEKVAEGIRELHEKKNISIEELQNNPTFIDCLTEASLIAIRNHHEEKINALKNAVFSSALPTAPEAAIQKMFLNFIGDLTDWHIRLLRLFQNPSGAGADVSSFYSGSLSQILIQIYPELEDRRTFYDRVWADLYQRGLTKTSSLHSTITAYGMLEQQTSEFGNAFLAFISEDTAVSVG